MKKLQWMTGALFSMALIVFLFFGTFELAMYADFGYYEREYEKYHVLEQLDMRMEDTMYVTREMMAYLRGEREELSVITTVEGKEQDFFNEQDRFHMGEVRELFLGGLAIRRVSVALALLFFVLLHVMKADWKRVIPVTYRYVLFVTVGMIALLGICAATDFNAVFTAFHHVFFDNDLWLFDPAEDYMIRMLPEGLFADMVLRIGVMFGASLLVLPAAVYVGKRIHD